MKHILVVSGWLVSSILTLLVSISTIHLVRTPRTITYIPSSDGHSTQHILSPNYPHLQILGFTSSIESADARPLLLAQFLQRYNSPLKPYDYWGDYLVKLADTYQFDYRLLPAIAMQESNLCKKIPEGSYNCLGLGIHSQGTWGFESYEANFDKAAEILKHNYIDIGLVTPAQIQTKYTPNSQGSWQFAVNQFMDRIQKADF